MNFKKLLMQSLLWRGLYFITILLLNVFLSRYLLADGAGWINYLTNFFAFIILIVSLNMESAVTYFASRQEISKPKLTTVALVVTAIAGLLVLAILAIYFGKIKNTPIEEKKLYLLYAFTYICGLLLTNFFTVLFYAQRNFFLPNFIMSLLNIGLIIYIANAGVGGKHFSTVLNVYFISFLVQGVLLWLAYATKNKIAWQFAWLSKEEWQKMFRYALLSLAANVVFFLVYRIDYWFVRHNLNISCTENDLGNYIQVSKLGQMLLIIPQILASAVFPHTASGIERAEVNKSVMIISRLLTQLFILLILVVTVIGKWFFPFVFGHTFNNMYVPMLLLLPGILSLSVLALLSAYFSGKGNVRINIKGAIAALIFVVIANYFLVPRYGIYAAAVVSSVAYTINLVYSLWQFRKDYAIGFRTFFAWQKSDFVWLQSVLFKNKN